LPGWRGSLTQGRVQERDMGKLNLLDYFDGKGSAEQRAEWKEYLADLKPRQLVRLRRNLRRAAKLADPSYSGGKKHIEAERIRQERPLDESKPLTDDDVLMLANSPARIIEAFNDLVDCGVDPVALAKLIRNRTRPIGRPANVDEIARLDFSVSRYQEEHPETPSSKAAIQGVLGEDAKNEKLVSRLEVALSRHRAGRRPQITKPPKK